MMDPLLTLGARRSLDARTELGDFSLPASHLTTHGVVVGMTGSGKTGLVTVLVEEALRAGVPVLVLDVKGDLPCLRLVPRDAAELAPWVDGDAAGVLAARREELASWGFGDETLAEYARRTQVRVVTPGADAGEMLHLFSALERRSARWDDDEDGARAGLSAAVSLLLRLVGRDGDPTKSREHALVSVIAEARARRGDGTPLDALVGEILSPCVERVGALPLDDFLSTRARKELAADVDTLLAAPSMASWRRGQSLDVAAWMEPGERTPATVVSVAHLDDEQRASVLGLVLEAVLAWVRSLPGTSGLRGLVVFDEVYGYVPPHPASPPTKKPLVALMKQARAYGVGCVLATQNPMDLDYRALGNAGLWCLGRLQTDADRERVMDGLGESATGRLAETVTKLAPRWFVTRDARGDSGVGLLRPRCALTWMRGPMTRGEMRRLVE